MNRFSLCIGVSNYQASVLEILPNARNDAVLIYDVLTARGFIGEVLVDPDDADLEDALDRLTTRLKSVREGDRVFCTVYFAGHGLELNGEGYVLLADFPVDPTLAGVARFGFPVARLIDAVATCNGPKLIIVDACRIPIGSHDPSDWQAFAAATAHARKAYPKVATASDVLIGYSTSAGMAAGDGVSGNSRYCEALSEGILEHNISVEELFSTVGQTVIRDSSMGQRPWYVSSLMQRVGFSDLANYQPALFETLTLERDPTARVFCWTEGEFVYHAEGFLVFTSGMGRAFRGGGAEIAAIFVRGNMMGLLERRGKLTVAGELEATIHIDMDDVHGMAGSPDGHTILVYGRDGCAVIRHEDGRWAIKERVEGPRTDFYGAIFVNDETAFVCGPGSLIRLSGFSGSAAIVRHYMDVGDMSIVYDLAWDPERQTLIAVGNCGKLAYFDGTTLQQSGADCVVGAARNRARDYASLRNGLPNDVAHLFLNDRQAFESQFDEETLDWAVRATSSQDLLCCTLLQDARVLAVGSAEGFVFLFDLRDRKLFHVLDAGGSLGFELQWMCADLHANALVTLLADGTMIRHDGVMPAF
ncbi:caspase family protein [Cupriavidus sp. UME77]|uniref:caspase family protein n=1 Tax=Cupriavidus sp. UME77 TaxID=1862321 RepID=UPI0016014977|nr:caspase family protein [Cupriavidus sp. UME77]